MADVKRDILLAIVSSVDMGKVKEAVSALKDLDAIVDRINSKTISLNGLDSTVAQVQAAAASISNLGAGTQKNMKGAKESIDDTKASVDAANASFNEMVKLTKNVVTTNIKGDSSTTSFGEISTGVTAKINRETGTTTVEENFKKQEDIARKSTEEKINIARREATEINKEIDRQEKFALDSARREATEINKEYDKRIQQSIDGARREATEINTAMDKRAQQSIDAARKEATEINQIVNKRREERSLLENKEAGETQKNEQKKTTFQDFSARPTVVKSQVESLDQTTGKLVQTAVAYDQVTGQTLKYTQATNQLTSSLKDLSEGTEKNGDSFFHAAGKVALWTAATGLVFGTIRTVKESISIFSDFEQATVRLERVGRGFASSNALPQAQNEIRQGARNVSAAILDLSVQFGASSDKAQTAAVVFARLGLSQKETIEATRSALLAQNVAGIDAVEAANLLTASFLSFKGQVSDIPDILNKLNTLENTTRITTDDLLQSVSRAGAVFREAGGTFEQLAAFTAVVGQATGRSGAEIGNAFKFIATRLGDLDTQNKVFDKFGIGIRSVTGELKPFNQLLGELVVFQQSATQAQRTEITTLVAGSRQRNILQTALDQYFVAQQKIIDQLRGENSAINENQQVIQTLGSKLQQLVSAFEKLAIVIVDAGLATVLKKIVDATTFLVSAFSSLGPVAAIVAGAVAAYSIAMAVALIGTDQFKNGIQKFVGTLITANQTVVGYARSLGEMALSALGASAANDKLASSIGKVSNSNAESIASNAAKNIAATSTSIESQGGKLFGSFADKAAGPAAAAATGTLARTTLQAEGATTSVISSKNAAQIFAEADAAAAAAETGALVSVGLLAAAAPAVGLVAKRNLGDGIKHVDSAEGSFFRQHLAVLEEVTRKDENRNKIAEEQKSLALTSAAALQDLDAQESDGSTRSVANQKRRIEIGNALAGAFQLEGKSLADAVAGQLSYKDALFLAGQAGLAQAASAEAAANARENELSLIRQQIAAKREELIANQALDKGSNGNKNRSFIDPIADFLRGRTNSEGFFTSTSTAVKTLTKDLKELQDEQQKKEAAKAQLEQAQALTEAYESLAQSKKRASEIEFNVETSSQLSLASRGTTNTKLLAELDEVQAKIQALKSDKDIQLLRLDPDLAEKFDHEVLDPLLKKERQIKVKLSIDTDEQKIEKAAVQAKIKFERELSRDLAQSLVPAVARPFAGAIADLETAQNQLRELQTEAARLDKILTPDRLSRASRGELGPTDGASNEEVQAAAARRAEVENQILEIRTHGAELINKAETASYQTQIKITEEKKKQTAEALKALGSLSDEDLVRQRLLLGKAKKGELNDISASQFLNADQETRKSLETFDKTFSGFNILGKAAQQLQDFAPEGFSGVKKTKSSDFLRPDEVNEILKSNQDLHANLTDRFADLAPASKAGGFDNNFTNSVPSAVNVNLEGLNKAADPIANAISLRITSALNQWLDETTNRAVTTPVRQARAFRESPR